MVRAQGLLYKRGEVMVTSEPISSLADLSSTSLPESSLGNAHVLSCNDEVITENPIHGSEIDILFQRCEGVFPLTPARTFHFSATVSVTHISGLPLVLWKNAFRVTIMLLGRFDSDMMSFSMIHLSSERSSRGIARNPNFGTVIFNYRAFIDRCFLSPHPHHLFTNYTTISLILSGSSPFPAIVLDTIPLNGVMRRLITIPNLMIPMFAMVL
ncbi:uncharacterized protein EI90DRAFT_181365 [Cantharellus anzutake]|uniref:uncharacterized protein n=1 Tax=Cantharellus anzutake TaxID=1750568 RepID=UPI00190776BC|nr:uncharacterized protein EI90DRAFT_181365 [Cantharellus anzutake]KAF8336492.1 hypothetical protein EI90DRAFT_181365 [Cantharellus anzutake]